MASNLRPPYEYQKIDELNYEFVNRDGINYHLYFTPISSIYPDLLNTYSFNIEREGTTPHPIDLRIAHNAIVAFVSVWCGMPTKRFARRRDFQFRKPREGRFAIPA